MNLTETKADTVNSCASGLMCINKYSSCHMGCTLYGINKSKLCIKGTWHALVYMFKCRSVHQAKKRGLLYKNLTALAVIHFQPLCFALLLFQVHGFFLSFYPRVFFISLHCMGLCLSVLSLFYDASLYDVIQVTQDMCSRIHFIWSHTAWLEPGLGLGLCLMPYFNVCTM